MVGPRRTRRATLIGLAASGCAARIDPDATRKIDIDPRAMRVLTLNVAHGRGRALLQTRARPPRWYAENLEAIARVLRREAPDVVALQEAEFGSGWAGDFDHVAYLARAAGYPHRLGSPHVHRPGERCYGTAILSRWPLDSPIHHTFTAQGRWFKGFSAATARAPWGGVEVASVHLDHASASVRRAQVCELIDVLGNQGRTATWMGDFNDSGTDDDAVRLLLESTALHAIDPMRDVTYPVSGRRLDWIFASEETLAETAWVLSDPVSDHRAVLASLLLEPPADDGR